MDRVRSVFFKFKSLFKGIKKYWRVIAAAVVSYFTFGAASGPLRIRELALILDLLVLELTFSVALSGLLTIRGN